MDLHREMMKCLNGLPNEASCDTCPNSTNCEDGIMVEPKTMDDVRRDPDHYNEIRRQLRLAAHDAEEELTEGMQGLLVEASATIAALASLIETTTKGENPNA
jgi:hypothetical protein